MSQVDCESYLTPVIQTFLTDCVTSSTVTSCSSCNGKVSTHSSFSSNQASIDSFVRGPIPLISGIQYLLNYETLVS